MSFMQVAVNRAIQGHEVLQKHVRDAIDFIQKHENTEEAFAGYLQLLRYGVIPYREYDSSDPFAHLAKGVSLYSPYDDLYMDRGVSKGWDEIYSILHDREVDDILLQDWKRAIIESRTTHYRYDW